VDWYESVDWEQVRKATGFGFRPTCQGLTWLFNPPRSPHTGGVFETIVKGMKRALKTVLTRADFDEEEFRTAVSKSMAMLNSRPIQQSDSQDDLEPLTPNHFLFGHQAGAVFPPDVEEEKNLSKRFKYQVMVQQHVWKRFHAEVAPLLGPRKKWQREQENIEVDELVVEMDEKLPRGSWRLMRVKQVFPSEDGFIRSVELISPTGKTYERSICRLIPITKT